METSGLPSIETPCLKPSRPNSPAAYRVALRTRTGGTWLDLELDLLEGSGRHGQDVGKGIA